MHSAEPFWHLRLFFFFFFFFDYGCFFDRFYSFFFFFFFPEAAQPIFFLFSLTERPQFAEPIGHFDLRFKFGRHIDQADFIVGHSRRRFGDADADGGAFELLEPLRALIDVQGLRVIAEPF